MRCLVDHGWPLCILVLAIVQRCATKDCEDDIKLGQPCDPAVDKTWYPVKDEFTQFIFCSPGSKKYVKNSCPELNGKLQYFDDETRKCFTPRSRMRRTPGVPKSSGIGEPCFFNTDCYDNMFCQSGRCSCNPGWVGAPSSILTCIKALNPGEPNCQYTIQCNGGWPGATCDDVSKVCTCPTISPNVVPTKDGNVCIRATGAGNAATAICPTPEGFVGSLAEVQTTVTTAGPPAISDGTTRKQCTVGINTDDGTGNVVCLDADIYDCIAYVVPVVVGTGLGICCPSRALVCIQPKKPGSADDGTTAGTRYWYNSVTNLCEPFQWSPSPTDSNGNNFRTFEHCMAYCGGTCQRGAPRLDADAVNTVTHVTSGCTSDSTCTADTGNSLISYECKTIANPSKCCPRRTSTCSNTGGRGNIFYRPVPTTFDVGTSYTNAIVGATTPYIPNPRWFWTGTACVQFTYGGRGGNFNNFFSQSDCIAFCGSVCPQGTPLKDQNGNNQACSASIACPSTYSCVTAQSVCCPRAQTVCIQPRQPGSCTNLAQRYYFNPNTRDCEVFDYTGCGGNDNNFPDYSSCLNFCRDIKPQPRCIQGEAQKNSGTGVYLTCSGTNTGCTQSYNCEFDGSNFGCCAPRSVTCSSQRNLGITCVSSAGTRYWYNPTTRICESFTYAGCDGNSNNFINRDDCDRYCSASGCPYGGQPLTEAGTSTRRICSSTVTCTSGYDCSSVLINNQPLNVCCLSRMTICSQNPQQGNPLGTQTTRYYFNPSTRLCTSFTFYGTGGNENNFINPSQCTNFCNSAACMLGETVLLDGNQQPTTCNQQLPNSCNPGYTCRQDTLFNRFVCCGSTDMGVCPTGEKAFVEPLTLQPRECTSGIVNQCSNNYLCRFSLTRNRNYCCISMTGVLCPAGRAVLRDATSRQPKSCFPSAVDQCLTSGYTCQPLTTGASQAGYCCTINPICPNNADFLLDESQNPRACIIQLGVNPCGTGAQCLSTTASSTSGFCCRTSGPTVDGCPAGQSVLLVGGVVQTCGGIGFAPFCPNQFTCVQNNFVSPPRFQCCGSTIINPTDPDGCGVGQIAFKETNTGAYRICQTSGVNVCPTGFGCQQTSAGQFRCCGRSEGCPANSVAQINPSSGQGQTCIIGQACSSNAFQCQQTNVGGICCSTGITDGIVTQPPRSPRCPFPNQVPYIPPGSATSLTCNPRSNTCPNGYPCLNGGSGFICCQPTSSGNQCATGSVAILNGQPQSCLGTTLPCPTNYRCTYSTSFRAYYCCSSTGIVTPPPSSNACPLSGRAYFTPGSPTPARCTLGSIQGTIGACPPGYTCTNSPTFQTTICCSGTAGAALVANRDSSDCIPSMFDAKSPLACGQNPAACPQGTTCRFSSTHRYQVCCKN